MDGWVFSLSFAEISLSNFTGTIIIWTEIVVNHKIALFMTPESVPASAALAPPGNLRPHPKARLKDQFHEVARFRHLSYRTETAYWD